MDLLIHFYAIAFKSVKNVFIAFLELKVKTFILVKNKRSKTLSHKVDFDGL